MQRWFICMPNPEREGEILFIRGYDAPTWQEALKQYSKDANPNRYYVLTPKQFREMRNTRG